ncbi:hypothetical protein B0T16DRAFT_390661 [Cercophora newfieldiana]|uniref:Uncharacterized protein n=1 Tax=Cercophora newfieldiana TaxID=92897 RepID=A0AA39Y7B1_9PEZI|nr:hypothetical protein B0T16DRAFT_390661 [Cercophora newfieldiana]
MGRKRRGAAEETIGEVRRDCLESGIRIPEEAASSIRYQTTATGLSIPRAIARDALLSPLTINTAYLRDWSTRQQLCWLQGTEYSADRYLNWPVSAHITRSVLAVVRESLDSQEDSGSLTVFLGKSTEPTLTVLHVQDVPAWAFLNFYRHQLPIISGSVPRHSALRFGDHPNGQPPTPKQTPTSAIFPSPVFQTPRQNQDRFEESGGWTPRFAEEYSVFNATPGNLRGSQGQFADFAAATPFTPALGAGQKRPLSAEGIAVEIACAKHFSQDPRIPLPPVEPSKQLKSSTSTGSTPVLGSTPNTEQGPGAAERSAKKARRDSAPQNSQGQTVTPPPSAHKSGRKLAPKLDTNEMQNDQGFGQSDFMGNPQQQPGMGGFVTTPSDMFSYPLSAPAGAQAFGGQRSFWDADMGGMDIDFSTNGNNVFQSPGSANWATNQFLQGAGPVHDQGDENTPTGKRDHPMTSQAPMQTLGTSAAEQVLFAASFPTSMEDPFGIANNGGGVNPGLLFSRPPSSSLDLAFQAPAQLNTAPAPLAPHEMHTGRRVTAPKPSRRGELRRSASEVEIAPKKQDRVTASSPIKPSGRPGLSRSLSESRGKNSMSRSSLPTLAPAPRAQPLTLNTAGAGRPVISQPKRGSGRTSPLKGHHQRLPSLSSIPETAGPRTRTHAKFMIDANGRARVETTVIVDDDDDAPPTVRKRHSAQPLSRQRWASSEDDDDSSTDDEPIIIPSRNTSFALPDPLKPTSIHPFHSSQRSVSERSTTSYTTFRSSQDDGDSDRETVINDATPTGKTSGDAASELRKLRESRRMMPLSAKPRRHKPTHALDGFEKSGGKCVNLTEQTMPSIYICAFCANTPNMRGGRIRDNGYISGAMGPRGGSATSPLAHKTFKFR